MSDNSELKAELERLGKMTPAQVNAELRAIGIDPDAVAQSFDEKLLLLVTQPAGHA